TVRLPVAGLDLAVATGELVAAHALVARSPATARWQRRVHTPLGGRVEVVDGAIAVHGAPAAATIEGRHRDPGSLDRDEVVAAAREAGIVGLGGGMFPTYAKLDPAHPIDTVLVNGCESEPYFTCDHRVLSEHRDELDCGLALAMRAVGARAGVVVDREAYYPAGYERFVVRDQLGRDIPVRKLPRDVGALVLNVQSVRALHRAVCLGEPLVSRVITVAGGAVRRPGNYQVLIGTPIAEVLAACGVDPAHAAAIVAGGPMMGHGVAPDDVITAGTGGVLALTAAEVGARAEHPCIRCGRCVDACPIGLPVPLLVERPGPEVLRCFGCGACHYVCPSAIPLTSRLREASVQEFRWE
ncbi:MAG: SLBB domain-containing protein, partial [Myxococcales bacterium]|nr:SLBB domain-containing protein [Myxococcales bacterium]